MSFHHNLVCCTRQIVGIIPTQDTPVDASPSAPRGEIFQSPSQVRTREAPTRVLDTWILGRRHLHSIDDFPIELSIH
jgi:hypothetical protein